MDDKSRSGPLWDSPVFYKIVIKKGEEEVLTHILKSSPDLMNSRNIIFA
jgi:hypothetical protein